MQTIWLSPTNFVTGDPTLRVSYPFASQPGTKISCTMPGNLHSVSMGLRLPPDAQIEEIVVCYEVSNPQSYIAAVRLAEMTTPDNETVIHDDSAQLTSTMPATYHSAVPGLVPSGAVTLELRLNFQNASDEIALGAVGITIQDAIERCVNSIADLRALAPGALRCAELLGYYAPGDGGGGEFYWDATSSEPDNAGTIIAPAPSPPLGRWKRIVIGPLSVKCFGAVGDGKTPASDAIQNTITFATTAKGGQHVVFLPTGTYVLDKLITISNGVTIKGTGASSVLTTPEASATTMSAPSVLIKYVGSASVSNITLEDFGVSTQAEISIAIYLESAISARLKGLTISLDAVDAAVCIISTAAGNCFDVEICGSAVVNSSGDGIRIDTAKGAAAGAAGIRIHNCDIAQNKRWGVIAGVAPASAFVVDCEYEEYPQELSIDSCVIEGNSSGGVWVSGYAFSLSNCHIEQGSNSSGHPVQVTAKDLSNINYLSSILFGCSIVGNNLLIKEQPSVKHCIYIAPVPPQYSPSQGVDIRGNSFGVAASQTLVYLENISSVSVGPNMCDSIPPFRRRQVTVGPNVTGLVVFDEHDLTVGGPVSTAIIKVTQSDYTLLDGDSVILYDGVAAGVTLPVITLPKANTASGRQIYVKNISSSNASLNLATQQGDLIDGVGSIAIAHYSSITVVSDGANWWVLAKI